MRTIDKIIDKVDCRFGAPMGRSNVGSRPTNKKIFESAVPMDASGAYDRGGAYWGTGNQLRVRYTKDLSYVEFFRVVYTKPEIIPLGNEDPLLAFVQNIYEDLLVTAIEGGSNYWYFLDDDAVGAIRAIEPDKNIPLSQALYIALRDGAKVPVRDLEDVTEILGTMDKDSCLHAMKVISERYPDVWNNIMDEQYDAGDADVFFQLAVMGELTFG